MHGGSRLYLKKRFKDQSISDTGLIKSVAKPMDDRKWHTTFKPHTEQEIVKFRKTENQYYLRNLWVISPTTA